MVQWVRAYGLQRVQEDEVATRTSVGWRLLLLSLPGRGGGEHGKDGHAGCCKRRKKQAVVCGPPHTPAMELAARADAGRATATRPACKYRHTRLETMLFGVQNHLLVNPVFYRSTMDGLLRKHKVYTGLGGTSLCSVHDNSCILYLFVVGVTNGRKRERGPKTLVGSVSLFLPPVYIGIP